MGLPAKTRIEYLRRDLQNGLSPSTPELLEILDDHERRIAELEAIVNNVRGLLVL